MMDLLPPEAGDKRDILQQVKVQLNNKSMVYKTLYTDKNTYVCCTGHLALF